MKTILTLLAGLLFGFAANAQTISHMDVFVQTHFSDSTILKEPQMFVVLNDTANITSFTVKLGTTNGGNDILDKIFIFGTEGEFQDGTSYSRDGKYVRLYLGKYATLPAYYAQVRATVSGSQQSAVTFSGE